MEIMVISSSLMGLFGRSPLKPLKQHMQKVRQCVISLQPFFEAVLSGNKENVLTIKSRIDILESEANAIKSDLRMHLPNSLFLPVARGDLLAILTAQDQLANRARDIAGLVYGRGLKIPAPIQSDFMILLMRSIDATLAASAAINELDELLESSFRGSEAKMVQRMISKIDSIEEESDRAKQEVQLGLFPLENTLSPIEVVFLYRLLDWVADLGNRAEIVGEHLELLLAH